MKFSVKVLTWNDQGQQVAIRFALTPDKQTADKFGKEFWKEFYDPERPKYYRKMLFIYHPDGHIIKQFKNFE